MSDKRSVATDALETLGTAPLDDKARRDAIHIAVEPVTAGEELEPGDHITVLDGVAWGTRSGEGLGIVDPFLTKRVKKGERFWFLMYPRQVTSLRHVWAHPAFPDEVGTPAPDATVEALIEESKAASERWLREFISTADCPSYDVVMELLSKGELPSPNSDYYDTGGEYNEDHLFFAGNDAHGEIPSEFWDHAEVVLGRPLKMRPTYFSCSC